MTEAVPPAAVIQLPRGAQKKLKWESCLTSQLEQLLVSHGRMCLPATSLLSPAGPLTLQSHTECLLT